MKETHVEKLIRRAEDRWMALEDKLKEVQHALIFCKFKEGAEPSVKITPNGEVYAVYKGHSCSSLHLVNLMKKPGYITPDDFN